MKFVRWMIAALIFACLGLWGVAKIRSNSPFAVTKTETPGAYFCFVANYAYKGEPVTLDFILTCSSEITFAPAVGASFLYKVGPQLYGVKLVDGKALIVSTLHYCDGMSSWKVGDSTLHFIREVGPGTKPHSVPDLLPATVLFDDPAHLTQGYLYLSDAAYARPNSPLKFVSATVTKVSYVEAAALAQKQIRNVANTRGNSEYIDFSEAQPRDIPVASTCRGFTRYEIPPSAKELVHSIWRPDFPRFWIPQDRPEFKTANDGSLFTVAVMKAWDEAHGLWWGQLIPTVDRYHSENGFGLPRGRFDGAPLPRGASDSRPGTYFPMKTLYLPPADRQRLGSVSMTAADLEIGPETEGLFHCGDMWTSMANRAQIAPEFSDGRLDIEASTAMPKGQWISSEKVPKAIDGGYSYLVNGRPAFYPNAQTHRLRPGISIFEEDKILYHEEMFMIAAFLYEDQRP